MADIKQIEVAGYDYDLKDSIARANMINKTGTDVVTGIINFQNGFKINSKVISVSGNNVNFDNNAVWNFGDGCLKSNGYAVLTTHDLNIADLVGQKDGNGEIFGDYEHNSAQFDYAFVAGEQNAASASHQFICGKYNAGNQNNLVEVGNGTSSSNRSNAFEIRTNGDVHAADFITPRGSFNEIMGSGSRQRFTNNTALTVNTTDVVILDETFTAMGEQGYGMVSIPVSSNLDGNIVITITTNLITKQIKKYCGKGFEIINFIFNMGAGTNSVEIKIKSEYVNSEIRNLKAQNLALTNYIMNLTYVAPVVDDTPPTFSIAASSIEMILIGA